MGLWDLLTFAMQMILILVLGNVLALTPTFQKLINLLLAKINSNTSAVLFTVSFSLLLSYFNWGLGLIFSALLARSIAQKAKSKGFKINYSLIVAAAYSGMMIWHGGLSGSAPLKVAENSHFLSHLIGVIPVSKTIFSAMNISLYITFLILIPGSFYILSKLYKRKYTSNSELPEPLKMPTQESNRQYIGLIFGLILAFLALYQFYSFGLSALNINLINLILLSLIFILYANLDEMMKAIQTAIVSSSGIMIQFPIYAGIMGLMKYSGLIDVFTNSLISISSTQSLPLYGFISAAVVNFFVPSGGGQWAIQGPILMEAAQQLQVSTPKMIMALAYGDQLTNMIQPFWAIPLLSISGVRAKQILPYTFIIMIIGGMASAFFLYLF